MTITFVRKHGFNKKIFRGLFCLNTWVSFHFHLPLFVLFGVVILFQVVSHYHRCTVRQLIFPTAIPTVTNGCKRARFCSPRTTVAIDVRASSVFPSSMSRYSRHCCLYKK